MENTWLASQPSELFSSHDPKKSGRLWTWLLAIYSQIECIRKVIDSFRISIVHRKCVAGFAARGTTKNRNNRKPYSEIDGRSEMKRDTYPSKNNIQGAVKPTDWVENTSTSSMTVCLTWDTQVRTTIPAAVRRSSNVPQMRRCPNMPQKGHWQPNAFGEQFSGSQKKSSTL